MANCRWRVILNKQKVSPINELKAIKGILALQDIDVTWIQKGFCMLPSFEKYALLLFSVFRKNEIR